MYYLASIEPTTLFVAGLAIAIIALLILEIYNSRRASKLTYPVYEYALKRAEDEATRIVEEARASARKLLTEAEAESIALAASHKNEDAVAEHAYEESLHSVLVRLETQLKENASAAQEAESRMSVALAAQLADHAKAASAHLAEAFASLEKENTKRIDEQLTGAFTVAHAEAEEYARARKAAVDSHVFALVGETTKIVLQKNLSADVHAELARAALEEAKANHVF